MAATGFRLNLPCVYPGRAHGALLRNTRLRR
jgi:hypothetical protein